MNIKLVSRYIGIALLFNALFMFLSVGVSMLYGFDSSLSPLLISGFITAIVGSFPLIFVKNDEDISLRDGFAITVFAWILSCIFGMLPYLIWGGPFTLSNAWFESVSGYTTTGSTILADVESLPHGLLFWRSSTHFIGGIGVVIFMLMVLPSVSTFRLRMSKMEISSLSKQNYRFQTKGTIRVIGTVYLGITVLSFVFLMIAGMGPFDAINHAFSIVSTGGFSTKNESILAYHSFPIELVSMFFMLASGLHFGMMYTSVTEHSLKIFRSPIIRYYLACVVIVSLAIGIDIKVADQVNTWGMAFRQSFFQVISVSTTTGLATTDSSVWPTFAIMCLMFMLAQGASSGSTAGGIKADRMWIFLQSAHTQIKKQLHPNAIIPTKVWNHTIDQNVSYSTTLYICLYILIVLVGSIVVSVTGSDFMDSFSASLASMSNVGPGFGSCGSLENYAHFQTFAKFFLTIEMLMGRLEIYAFLLLFSIFKKN